MADTVGGQEAAAAPLGHAAPHQHAVPDHGREPDVPAQRVEAVARQREAVATRVPTVPRWVAPAFAILAVGTVPWVVYLAVTLPQRATAVHYRAVWVGFDVGLVCVLALTAYHAWRGHPRVTLPATAAATMLFVDAWFDVLTTPRHAGLLLSVVLAGAVELPLAGVCLWIALHAEDVVERRLRYLARRTAKLGQPSLPTG